MEGSSTRGCAGAPPIFLGRPVILLARRPNSIRRRFQFSKSNHPRSVTDLFDGQAHLGGPVYDDDAAGLRGARLQATRFGLRKSCNRRGNWPYACSNKSNLNYRIRPSPGSAASRRRCRGCFGRVCPESIAVSPSSYEQKPDPGDPAGRGDAQNMVRFWARLLVLHINTLLNAHGPLLSYLFLLLISRARSSGQLWYNALRSSSYQHRVRAVRKCRQSRAGFTLDPDPHELRQPSA